MAEPRRVSAMADPTGAVTPTPTDDEVVAIMAAFEALWPRPAATVEAPKRNGSWRFSGRWWAKPVSARRDRPFR